MSTSINIISGLGIPAQIPLNPKENSASEATLKDLGLNDNLAFTYEKGLIVYCRLEGTRYEWREVLSGEELTGLRDTDFIYPDGTITDGVDYSNKKYNFFPTISTITPSEVYIEQGDNIIITGAGVELDPLIINGLSSPLNQIDEGNGNGIIIRNRTSINYGNIGLNAVDFSYNNVSSSTKGATGLSSFSINKSNTSSGENSFTGGLNNIASNLNSFSFGENNESNNINTVSLGSNIISSGISAIGIGKGLNSKSFLETVLGSYNSNYTPISTSTWSATDRLFTIGNGFNEFNKSDALLIYKNGLALLPSITNSLIENATGKAIVTREYLESILPTTVDGSETKLLAGTNIIITGNGTTPTPYIISYDADDISQYTDEMARDAVGTILENSNTITFNYDDVLETIEANVNINGSSTSTGILSGGDLSIGTLNTLWTIQAGSGYIYNSLTNTSQPITWLTQEDNTATYLTTNISTYILIDNTGTVVQQITAPTQQQLRTHIYIGKLAHATLSTILFTVTEPCRMFDISGQIGDLNRAIGPVNVGGGNVINHNGSNLTISATAGGTYRPGANYLIDRNSPSITSEPQVSTPTFRQKYRNGSGGWIAVNSTTIDPDRYDNNSGSLVTVPTGKFTVQVFWRFGNTGTIHVDYGQTYYDTLEQARASIGGAIVIQDPDNVRDAVKRGWLVVKQNTNVLNNSSDAVFIQADKFGERGATGAIPDLQSTYNNSSSPEILTNSVLGAFSLKRGSTADIDNVFEIINGAGFITSTIKGDGALTALTYNGFNPTTDLRNINTTSPLLGGGNLTTDRTLTIQQSTISQDGYLSSVDWNIFNNKQPLLGYTPENLANKATDFTTVNNTLYPTVQATKTYADGLVVGLLNDRGSYDASTNLYPSTGGSGTSGAILKGNLWAISVAGTLGGVSVGIGDWVRALTDTPGQTAANWSVVEGNFGYVPANDANVVHLAGTETITGNKTTSGTLTSTGGILLDSGLTASSTGAVLSSGATSHVFMNSKNASFGAYLLTTSLSGSSKNFSFPNQSGTFALTTDLHNPVTIGTANGLSLSTQALSLGLSSASTNGALSSTDWSTFNNKAAATGETGYIQNQNASPQSANMWINGNGLFDGSIISSSLIPLVFRNSSNILRWEMDRESPETGSNAGSNLTWYRYDDSGNYLGTVFSMNRQTGLSSFYGPLSVTGNGTFASTVTASNGTLIGSSEVSESAVDGTVVRRSGSGLALISGGYLETTLATTDATTLDTFATFASGSGVIRKNSVSAVKTSLGITNAISGTLTSGYIPKATGANSLGNSIVQDNGSDLGIGVTPTAGGATQNFEMLNGSTFGSRILIPQLYISSNAVGQAYSSTRKVDGFATQIVQQGFDGTMSFNNAISSTAGSSISWNTAMHISASSNVGIGTTSPTARLTIEGVSAGAAIDINNTTASLKNRIVTGNVGGALQFENNAGTEIARLTQGGNVLIGTTTDDGVNKLQVNGSLISKSPSLTTGIEIGRLGFSPIGFSTTSSYIKSNFEGANWFNGSNLTFFTSSSADITTNPAIERMSISGAGVVKINSLSGTGGFVKSDTGGNLSTDSTVYAPLASPALTGTPTAPTATAGTNTTQIATMAALQAALRPYKIYTSLLSQTGTSAPTAIVLENTLGGTITFTRSGVGVYLATLTGVFTVDKTWAIANMATNAAGYIINADRLNSNDIQITVTNPSGALADGWPSKAPLEIRVYN